MVGSAIWRRLTHEGYNNLIGRSSTELDLRNQQLVADFIAQQRPDVVIDAAARVGGILANSQFPYNFLMENLLIQNNLITSSVTNGIRKFIFLGSSCIYPKLAPQPLKEEFLLTGPLEPTNEWYAIAKIAGVKAVEAIRRQFDMDYVSLMPTNLYGPHDNFDLHSSHVLPAMIRKFHEGTENGERKITLWGSGTPMREFLHVDDLASAVLFSLNNKLNAPLFNVGTGKDLTIIALAKLVQEITGFTGEIFWDTSKPDGTPRKLLDVSKIQQAGWSAQISLRQGIEKTYSWYKDNQRVARSISYS